MDAFGWSTQPAAAAAAAATDDAFLVAFLGGSFDQLHSDVAGVGTTVSSEAYGLDLPSSSQHDLGMVGFLPVAGAHDGGMLDRFAFPDVPKEHAQAGGSNTAFSGYSTTTGGGNISSGESNTYGGHDTEVASSSRPVPVPLPPPTKRKLLDKYPALVAPSSSATTSSVTFGQSGRAGRRGYEPDTEAIAQVKEMIYHAAAMRPVNLGPSSSAEPSAAPDQLKPRRRKNVRISSDPQTVAARLRREKVSERLRALQRLVPGGSKMDTASMLDEAASYLLFLKSQLAALETLDGGRSLSLQQRYATAGGRSNPPRRAAGGADTAAVQLAFGRDGVAGYVKPHRDT